MSPIIIVALAVAGTSRRSEVDLPVDDANFGVLGRQLGLDPGKRVSEIL